MNQLPQLPLNMPSNETENVEHRGSQLNHIERRLQIDNVLEVGPVIPDGGYGWIILATSFYIKNVIPAFPMTYGIFLMFSTIETGTRIDGNFNLWSNTFVCTPLLFVSTQSVSEPICHAIIKNSKWPRFVSLCGICLLCASILMLWLSIVDGFAPTTLHVFSGILAGIGSSLLLTQIDILISQYFRLKLIAVQAVLRVGKYSGIIFTALLLGKHLNANGLPQTIIWYHLLVLLSGLAVLSFKKPSYLKGQSSVYSVIRAKQHDEEDEEDIFSKTTELQSPHTSLPPNINDPSTSIKPVSAQPQNSNNWEQFSDDENDENQMDQLPAPRELFAEGQINNNVTYSFENVDTRVNTNSHADDANIFLPVQKAEMSHAYLKDLGFYNTCLIHISIKYSSFVFFTLFPSYLYYSVNNLHKEIITRVIGIIFIGVILEAIFIGCWKVSRTNRVFPIALLMWISASGHLIISDWKKEMLIGIGAILVTTSACALEYISKSFIANTGQSKIEYTALKLICGLSMVLFFVINPTYENCFRIVGLIQFSSGSICFCNFVYSKISKVY